MEKDLAPYPSQHFGYDLKNAKRLLFALQESTFKKNSTKIINPVLEQNFLNAPIHIRETWLDSRFSTAKLVGKRGWTVMANADQLMKSCRLFGFFDKEEFENESITFLRSYNRKIIMKITKYLLCGAIYISKDNISQLKCFSEIMGDQYLKEQCNLLAGRWQDEPVATSEV